VTDPRIPERGAAAGVGDIPGDFDGLDALDDEIARVRAREERRLVERARRAGYFRVRIRNDEFDAIFRDAFMSEPRPRSTLDRLEARRRARHAGERARDVRRKALLGGFVVAQCRYRPGVHARLAPDIGEWLETHRSGSVAERNVAALEGFLADPGHRGTAVPAGDTARARRARTHRLILLGAWVLARRGSVGELSDLVAAELGRFLDQGRRAYRDRALLADVLGG